MKPTGATPGSRLVDCPESVSIIVPVFNEGDTVAAVIRSILEFIETVSAIRWEVVVVDDGSVDQTPEVIRGHEGITVITHPENRGYGAALKSGIHAASGEYVLIMDSDGQHIASESLKLIENGKNHDMTIGCRVRDTSHIARRPGKMLIGWLANWLIRAKVPDVNSGHRLIRRATILRYIHVCSNRFSFSLSSTIALLTEGHFVRYVDIETQRRQGSRSQVGIGSGLSVLLQILRLAMVFHPLRVYLPLTCISLVLMSASLVYDISTRNISDTSLFFLMVFIITGCFGFLSDQISQVRREIKAN